MKSSSHSSGTESPGLERQNITIEETRSVDRQKPLTINERVKVSDSRRATPRQVKQQRHPASGSPTSRNKATSKRKENKTKDAQSSFIRTASSHFRSTISKLRRADSGLSLKPPPQQPEASSRRRSDPILKESLPTEMLKPEGRMVAKPKDYNNESPSPPPGCSKWSTRLDPPPSVEPEDVPRSRTQETVWTTARVSAHPQTRRFPVDSPRIPYQSAHPYTGSSHDEVNALVGDCVIVGDSGRVNYRTGSFMCRFPNSETHPQQTIPRQQPLSNVSVSQNIPLYLAPCHVSVSGHTTRSAPSPCSVSNPSAESDLQRTYIKTKSLLNKGLQEPDELNVSSQTSPEKSNSLTVFPDLDPVLDRLLMDASSIDKYRTALRPQMVNAEQTVTILNRKSPKREPVQTLRVEAVAYPHMSNDVSVQNEDEYSKITSHSEPPVNNLGQQIRDLIQLEVLLEKAPGSQMRSSPKLDITASTEEDSSPKCPSSNKSLVMEPEQESSNGFDSRTRFHAFRWSTGPSNRSRWSPSWRVNKKSSPKPSILIQPATSKPEKERASEPGLRRPPSTIDNSPVHKGLWGRTSDMQANISFWELTATQLSLLRKLALVQITSLTQKYCTNRSPFNWLFTKNRSTANAPDINASKSLSSGLPSSNEPSADAVEPMENASRVNGIRESSKIKHTPPPPPVITNKHILTSTPVKRWTPYMGPVFGQSLENWQRRLGYPLPFALLNMMEHLEVVGGAAHGIFRRPGRKLRMRELREKIEQDLDWCNFNEWQPFDVADLLKQFFRELPECLLTDKLSVILLEVFGNIPSTEQFSLLRWAILGLPDENRTVLQRLLQLLHNLTRYADVTQMNAANLAVCFAPSLFRFPHISGTSYSSSGLSPRRLRRTTSGPDPKDLADQHTAQLCLAQMISHAHTLFQIPVEILHKTHLIPNLQEPRDLEMIIPGSDWPSWIQAELSNLSRECSATGGRSGKGWTNVSREVAKTFQSGSSSGDVLDNIELHYRKPVNLNDNSSAVVRLRTWRCSAWIPRCKPEEVLEKLWNQRASWDPETACFKTVEQVSDCVDLCLQIQDVTAPELHTAFYLIRGYQSNLDDGACAIICESVMPSTSENLPKSITLFGNIYMDHVYIRPENAGCRVCMLSKVDIMGHTEEWYTKHWGHTLVRRMLHLKRSLRPPKEVVFDIKSNHTNP